MSRLRASLARLDGAWVIFVICAVLAAGTQSPLVVGGAIALLLVLLVVEHVSERMERLVIAQKMPANKMTAAPARRSRKSSASAARGRAGAPRPAAARLTGSRSRRS